ncbi:MAG TPA: sulfatase-like hydrolase/transferase [Anaerolineales bacterium]|nr:sulfatase-like hydrolase/transferase [Anaerolineales bacterium]
MTDTQFNRRDFLKLASMLPAAYYLPKTKPQPAGTAQTARQNIIFLVYDAWSASNVSLYGYPRETMPHLSELAEKAIVYHNHYAGGIFTYPGTSALLTGTLNWTNQAYYYNKTLDPFFHENNLFSLFASHDRIAYTHNTIAEIVLNYMLEKIDHFIPHQETFLKRDFWLPKVFGNDYDTASVAWVRNAKKLDAGYANSLFLSRLYHYVNEQWLKNVSADFPLGLPAIEGDNYFKLEDATDWIVQRTNHLDSPYIGYFHLLPPHAPYRTRMDFFNRFHNDGYTPPKKPEHIFTQGESEKELKANRTDYDEYLLYVDEEFKRLYDQLEANGRLENTWIILTSDHGEIFERGIKAHGMWALFQPLMHVPLLIFPPGQTQRQDIYTPTSVVDLVPTLLHLAGKDQVDWTEGSVLPPFNPNFDTSRPSYAMDTRFSEQYQPFTNASIMMRKENYKLIYHFGTKNVYKRLNGKPLYELFDIDADPEELVNLYDSSPRVASILLDELLAKLEEKNVRE